MASGFCSLAPPDETNREFIDAQRHESLRLHRTRPPLFSGLALFQHDFDTPVTQQPCEEALHLCQRESTTDACSDVRYTVSADMGQQRARYSQARGPKENMVMSFSLASYQRSSLYASGSGK